MAVSVGLLSLTQIKDSQQKHSDSKPDQQEEGHTRSFAQEATNNDAGTTWPPHSYTCSFCRREFRSAQALGGHMNVHRRDRAKLHHPAVAAATSSTRDQHLVKSDDGLCVLYSIPNSNKFLFSKTKRGFNCTSLCQKKKKLDLSLERSCTPPCDTTHTLHSSQSKKEVGIEELDLELRLGRGFH